MNQQEEETLLHYYRVYQGPSQVEFRLMCGPGTLEDSEGHVLWKENEADPEGISGVTCPFCLAHRAHCLETRMAAALTELKQVHKTHKMLGRRIRESLMSWRAQARREKNFQEADEMTQLLENIPKDW